MLQKGSATFNFFKLLARQKKMTKDQSDISKNINSSDHKDNIDIGSSQNDIKVSFPSIKDMEFSWFDNY